MGMMMSQQRGPPELVLEVISYLGEKDLSTLCMTSKWLLSIVQPCLYASIDAKPHHILAERDLSIYLKFQEKLCHTLQIPRISHLVRSLRVAFPACDQNGRPSLDRCSCDVLDALFEQTIT